MVESVDTGDLESPRGFFHGAGSNPVPGTSFSFQRAPQCCTAEEPATQASARESIHLDWDPRKSGWNMLASWAWCQGKRESTMTPAMAAGITDRVWSLNDLTE